MTVNILEDVKEEDENFDSYKERNHLEDALEDREYRGSLYGQTRFEANGEASTSTSFYKKLKANNGNDRPVGNNLNLAAQAV